MMATAKLYSKSDWKRALASPVHPDESYRPEVRRDYARVIHSPSFRRLQGKTQLFPSPESDFFRNRITHSLEVAQIAKSIAARLNALEPALKKNPISEDLAEVAGLIHDLGHPPFGHNGEKALDNCMRNYGGFEGNAQTIRIITKLEKKEFAAQLTNKGKESRVGLNLCYRTIAAALKYDSEIRFQRGVNDKFEKGYYQTEADIVAAVKAAVAPNLKEGQTFKTVECQIMDIADDIAYSTYDLEDSFKAGFISPVSILAGGDELLDEVSKAISKRAKFKMTDVEVIEILKRIFAALIPDDDVTVTNKDEGIYYSSVVYAGSDNLIHSGYHRTAFTSLLIKNFVAGIKFEYNEQIPALSKVVLEENIRKEVEVLKNITYVSMIMSPRLKIVEHRGYQIVKEIFECLSDDEGMNLMPIDFQRIYKHFTVKSDQMRAICDFIAGMTDRYAVEFYGRLKSATPESIFKPY